jgi:hypothetical protein
MNRVLQKRNYFSERLQYFLKTGDFEAENKVLVDWLIGELEDWRAGKTRESGYRVISRSQ